MPALPDITDLGPRPVAQPRRTPVTVRNAGAIGEAVSEIGRVGGQVIERIQEIKDEDNVRRLDVEHAAAAREIRQRARQAHGLNAQEARQAADRELSELDQRILGRARSGAARGALETMIARRSSIERDSISDYAERETTNAMGEAITARIDTSLDEAEDHWNNPEAVERSLTTAVTEIENEGRWRGSDPALVQHRIAAARSRVRSSVVEQRIQADDYDGALAYLNEHHGEIDHDHEVRLRGLINGELQLQQADSDAATVLSGGGTAPAPASAVSRAPQPVTPGNIDVSTRPAVRNRNGSVSTVRTISIGTDQGEVLIPTVVNGRVVSEQQAIAHYRRTGENLGTFRNAEEATAYARALHDDEAARVAAPAPASPAPARRASGQPAVALDGNNPGGINDGRFASRQPGYVGANGRYAAFRTMQDGVNAQKALLRSYVARGIDTPMEIAERWAPRDDPSGRNNPVAYAQNVAQTMGIGVNDRIGPAQIDRFANSQARQENHAFRPGMESRTPEDAARTPPPDGSRIDIEAAYARIDAMPWNESRKRRARERVRQVAADNDLVRGRDRQDADEQIAQALAGMASRNQRLTNINQLPASALARASPNTILQINQTIQANNQPREPEANSPLMAGLINMAAQNPNGFIREVNPELYRGRITDGEVMQLHNLRNTIENQHGPQPSQIMGMIRFVLPETGLIPTNVGGQRLGSGNSRETEAQVRGRITDQVSSQIFSGVQQRLARNFPRGTTPSEQDILDAVRAEVTPIVINGQNTRYYQYRQQNPGREIAGESVVIPTRSLPSIDSVLRAAGLPVTGPNRVSEYLRHKSRYDAR